MRVRGRRDGSSQRVPSTRGGLKRRTIAASGILAFVVGAAFFTLILAVRDVRSAERRSDRSQTVLIAANALERLVLDLETGQRGFILTGQERFLEPWMAARQSFPGLAANLMRLVAGDPADEARARRIARAERSYIAEYSVPLVAAARRGDSSARSIAATAAGKRRVDAIRRDFDALIGSERRTAAQAADQADNVTRRTAAAAALGFAGSIALIALYAGYLTRAIVRPVRRAAAMAGRLAGGDLAARMPETGAGEIGGLERAFNVMGESLERNRDELGALVGEQTALRRVATLVARGGAPEEVFSAVAEELAQLVDADLATLIRYEGDGTATVVGGWSGRGIDIPIGSRLTVLGEGVAVRIRQTGEPARVERFAGPPGSIPDFFHRSGARAGAGSPIVVDGQLWGVAIAATAAPDRLPAGTEFRTRAFTELVATAIANAESREELQRVAAEQAALRRVATLVAEGASPSALFASVAAEVGSVLPDVDLALVGRYDGEGGIEFLGGWLREGEASFVGRRVPLGGQNVATLVSERNAAARVDRLGADEAPATTLASRLARSSAGAPISVEGRLWGVITVGSTAERPLPSAIEQRLAEFTDLVATAIANSQAREEVTALAADQVALRRVATLVARAAPPEEVFAAVAAEVGLLLSADQTVIGRYEETDTVTGVAGWRRDGATIPLSGPTPVAGYNLSALVLETGRPARIDGYEEASGASAEDARARGLDSGLAAPIVVESRLWGLMIVGATSERAFPPGAEAHLTDFTELVATAIANAEAREELRRVAGEQAALRRVATLVAEAAAPSDVFAAVAEEVGLLLRADTVHVARYESDGTVSAVGAWNVTGEQPELGGRRRLREGSASAHVRETGRPSRIDNEAAGDRSELGVSSSVAAPITVTGRGWGVISVSWSSKEPPSGGIEDRLADFTELIATAIANAEAQSELTESRARIVASADETRRRIERDLHDGAQQRLVSLALQLRGARASLPAGLGEVAAEVDLVTRGLQDAIDELREFARGIHPAIIAEGGLGPALRTLARRSAIPVELDMRAEGRLPEPVEIGIYYVVSEALTNAAKHSQATSIAVDVAADDAVLRVCVRDDGVGGAVLGGGSGLVGLKDRIEALGGRLRLRSERGTGTALFVELPLNRIGRAGLERESSGS